VPTRYVTGPRLWLAMATVYVIWGSTYLGIAIAIETMPPFLMAAFRFAVAGLLLLGWDVLRDPAARHLPTRRELLHSALVGILLLGIANGFVAFGEQTVPSGIAAILIGMVPLWLALLGWVYYRDRLPRIVVVAIVVGFAGVALLLWPAGVGANSFDLVGVLVLIAAPIAWAHGSLLAARSASLPKRPLTASGLQMLAAAIFLVGEGLLTGEASQLHPETFSPASIAAVAYLIVFGSMLAYTAYGWLLRHAPISLVGTYAYVNPVVAVGLGTIFLHEEISPRTLLASAIVLGAVAMIVTARGRATRAANAERRADEATIEGTQADRSTGITRLPAPPRAPTD
jgi:drug/metabolite transporter (DMT)-like permease